MHRNVARAQSENRCLGSFTSEKRDGEEFTASRPPTGHEVRPPAKEDAEAEAAETDGQEEVSEGELPSRQSGPHECGAATEPRVDLSRKFEMTELDALLAGIVSEPLEETRWLVLAENDDPRVARM